MWDYSYMKSTAAHFGKFATTARQRIAIADTPAELDVLMSEIDQIAAKADLLDLTPAQRDTLDALHSRAERKTAKLA